MNWTDQIRWCRYVLTRNRKICGDLRWYVIPVHRVGSWIIIFHEPWHLWSQGAVKWFLQNRFSPFICLWRALKTMPIVLLQIYCVGKALIYWEAKFWCWYSDSLWRSYEDYDSFLEYYPNCSIRWNLLYHDIEISGPGKKVWHDEYCFCVFYSMSFYKYYPLRSVIFQYGIIFVFLFVTLHAPFLVLLHSSGLLINC